MNTTLTTTTHTHTHTHTHTNKQTNAVQLALELFVELVFVQSAVNHFEKGVGKTGHQPDALRRSEKKKRKLHKTKRACK